MTTVPDDEAELITMAADLLYPSDDPRHTTWPDPQVLGLIRSRLRGIADWLGQGPR